MKLFLSVDMEGITGLPDHQFVEASKQHYERACRIMTGEANAIIEGALDHGASDILVNDSHSSMTNLLVDELHPEATIITGGNKPLSMVQSLDDTYAGAIFAGYHARAGQPGAMSHTISLNIRNIYIDDILVGEIGFNAYVAGHYGVPIIMVAGDDGACREAEELFPNIVTATVKQAISRSAVKTLHPQKANELLKEKVQEAIQKIDQMKPFVPPKNPVLRVEFANYGQAENASLMPGCVIEKNTTIVRFEAKDIIEAYQAMIVMARLAGPTTYS